MSLEAVAEAIPPQEVNLVQSAFRDTGITQTGIDSRVDADAPRPALSILIGRFLR